MHLPFELEISEEEHKRLVTFIEGLVAKDPPADSPEGAALLLLATIAGAYEAIRYPMGASDGPPYDAATRTGMYDPEGG